jgi:membrane protease YdiL (CAAX protease family)
MERLKSREASSFIRAYFAVVLTAAFTIRFLPNYSAAVNGLLMIGIPALLYRKSLRELGFRNFGRGLAYGLAVSGVILLGYYLLCKFLGRASPLSLPSLNLLAYLLTVAVSEEVFFRGFFYSTFENEEIVKGLLTKNNLLSSLLFGIAHALIYYEPSMFKVFFPSLVMGWLYERSGSILASITFHFLSDLVYQFARCL